jgi:hypothetical protein
VVDSSFKRCSRCREEKPREAFVKNRTTKDGLHSWCKECKAENSRRRYEVSPEKQLEYVRRWARANREKARETRRSWQKANSENIREYHRRYREQHPERRKAQRALYSAVESGALVKPDACWHCGNSPAEAHHASYAEDMWLLVTWLCRPCHKRLHVDHERYPEEAT